MAQRQRQRRRKKRHPLRNFIMLVAIVGVVASALYVTISNMGRAENMLEKTAYPIKYSEFVDRAADKYNLDKTFIYAIIHTESHFNPDCESYVGAQGLMQIMPETFQWLAKLKKETVSPSDYKDPETNIDYGCYFLKYLTKRYQSKTLAAAAYNAGFNAVDNWLKDPSISPDGKTLESIPYPETDNYVKKVKKASKMYRKLYF